MRRVNGILKSLLPKPRASLSTGIGSRVKVGGVRRCIDQSLLGCRRTPRLMCQATERQPGRWDPTLRAIDDRGDGNQRKGIGGAIANLSMACTPGGGGGSVTAVMIWPGSSDVSISGVLPGRR